MRALDLTRSWPVENVAAAIVSVNDAHVSACESIGDPTRRFPLASLSKPITAWAIMIGVEEGVISLDGPLVHAKAPPGCTLRHLLSHASGLAFDGPDTIANVERRRAYSNTGIERAADELVGATNLPFSEYLKEAVLDPLGMTSTELCGSPAYAIRSTIHDLLLFVTEMLRPALLARNTWQELVTPQFPRLAGKVPDIGRFDPCPWGLGVEIRGEKHPHWTGKNNSPSTFGHFGATGTMMWADPEVDIGVVALTDRRFETWRDEALQLWSELSDAAIAEYAK